MQALKGVELQLYSSLISVVDRVGSQHHVPAVLPPRMSRYPLYRRLGGPRKIPLVPGFDFQTFQSVASRYTD